MNNKKIIYLLPFILAIFLVLSESVERSMYTDGVAYAGLAMNMANGVGSLWYPKLSEIHHFSFHEHPPLVFGIQSLFFRMLGDSLVTERLYALFIFLCSGGMIVALWRKCLATAPLARKLWFIPLTIWLANEVVYHFYPANVLEPTMTLFTLAAVYCCLLSVEQSRSNKDQLVLMLGASLLLFISTLCKGFVALFPLAFYACYWLVFRTISIKQVITFTLILVSGIALGYLILWQYDPARISLTRYFDSQVIASLLSERSYENHFRSSRFYIVRKCFLVMLPGLLLAVLISASSYFKTKQWDAFTNERKHAYLFLLLGVCASLPLAISPKQSFYYLLPSMAYYMLGFSLFAAPYASELYHRTWTPPVYKLVSATMIILLIGSAINTYRHWGVSNNRDQVVLHDLDQINSVLEEGAIVGAAGRIKDLVSYGFRLNQLSLDTTTSKLSTYEYVIAPLDDPAIPAGAERVPLNTESYGLYRNK